MYIATDQKLMFLSNQKCASTSVRSVVKGVCDVTPKSAGVKNHINFQGANDWLEHAGYNSDAFRSLTVIRNPWARILSFFRHIRNNGSDSKFWSNVAAEESDFRSFLKRSDVQSELETMAANRFAYDPVRDRFVYSILKFENLSKALPKALNRFGIDCQKVPHSRDGGGNTGYRDEYDSATRATVREVFAADIYMGRYTF